jgi:hypothetical protein
MSVTAYVENCGPEGYRYWNPIKGTEADDTEACRDRLEAWIVERAAQLGRPVEAYRATRRFEFHTTPAHGVGRYV